MRGFDRLKDGAPNRLGLYLERRGLVFGPY